MNFKSFKNIVRLTWTPLIPRYARLSGHNLFTNPEIVYIFLHHFYLHLFEDLFSRVSILECQLKHDSDVPYATPRTAAGMEESTRVVSGFVVCGDDKSHWNSTGISQTP